MSRAAHSWIPIAVAAASTLLACSSAKQNIKEPAPVATPAAPAAELGELTLSEYVLGIGDEVQINVFRHNEFNTKTKVSQDGMISIPLVGDVVAGGVGLREFRDNLNEGLSKYLVEPQVTVEVTAPRSHKIYVLGEVKNPSVFPIEGPVSTVEAIALAGGFSQSAKASSVILIRGDLEKPQLTRLNLDNTLKKADFTQNPFLEKGDIIFVPPTFIANLAQFFDDVYKIVRPLALVTNTVIYRRSSRRGGGNIQVVTPPATPP